MATNYYDGSLKKDETKQLPGKAAIQQTFASFLWKNQLIKFIRKKKDQACDNADQKRF